MQATFIAPDIECDGCANSIKNALGGQPGVTAVDVSVPTKTVTVEFDQNIVSAEALAGELAEIGFPADR